MVVGIVPGPKGLALRTIECRKCVHSFARTGANDPINAVCAGWITGELNPPIQVRPLERLRWEIAPGSRLDRRPLRLPSPPRALSEVKSSAGGVR
jgi:hypothetical protein